MAFSPVLPARLPRVAELAAAARVVEGGAADSLPRACGGDADVPPGELVVWAWTCNASRDRVVLVDHPGFGVLLPPGGRVEVGEDLVDAVVRELFEETGLRPIAVDPVPALVDRVCGELDDGRRFETYGFAFVVVADDRTELVAEPGQAAAWYPLEHAPDRASQRHWSRMLAAVGQDAGTTTST